MMRLSCLTLFLAMQVFQISDSIAAGWESRIIWNVGSGGRFDKTHKGYVVTNNRVLVNIDDKESKCPVGFRRLSNPQDSVKEIVFRYGTVKPGRYWLHIRWHPGNSGKEQFEVVFNGNDIGKSQLMDGTATPNQMIDERFLLVHEGGQSEILLRYLSGDGMRFSSIVLAIGATPLFSKPKKSFQKRPTIESLDAYEKEINEPGVFLNDDRVLFYAPKRYHKEAKIIHGYLLKAYDELYKIVGVNPGKIIVYSLPKEKPYHLGITTRGKIWYTYENLDFRSHEEWNRHRIPHIVGYIEEMAHNFVWASHARFGSEMVGWSISRIVTEKVAGNPVSNRNLIRAKRVQAETFARYKNLDHTFPEDIPANLCDRIHAHILNECAKQYGPQFWPDFFTEIRKVNSEFLRIDQDVPFAERGDARYQITIECFDRIMDGKFTKLLQEHKISRTKDVLPRYLAPDWNRKYE